MNSTSISGGDILVDRSTYVEKIVWVDSTPSSLLHPAQQSLLLSFVMHRNHYHHELFIDQEQRSDQGHRTSTQRQAQSFHPTQPCGGERTIVAERRSIVFLFLGISATAGGWCFLLIRSFFQWNEIQRRRRREWSTKQSRDEWKFYQQWGRRRRCE